MRLGGVMAAMVLCVAGGCARQGGADVSRTVEAPVALAYRSVAEAFNRGSEQLPVGGLILATEKKFGEAVHARIYAGSNPQTLARFDMRFAAIDDHHSRIVATMTAEDDKIAALRSQGEAGVAAADAIGRLQTAFPAAIEQQAIAAEKGFAKRNGTKLPESVQLRQLAAAVQHTSHDIQRIRDMERNGGSFDPNAGDMMPIDREPTGHFADMAR